MALRLAHLMLARVLSWLALILRPPITITNHAVDDSAGHERHVRETDTCRGGRADTDAGPGRTS